MRQSVRLAIAFFVLSTLPVAFISYVSIVNAERAIEHELENHLSAIVQTREEDYLRWVRHIEEMVESIAQRPLVIDLATHIVAQEAGEVSRDPSVAAELVTSHLLPHLRTEGLFESLSIVASGTGRVLVSTEDRQVGAIRIGEAYFLESVDQTYFGKIRFAPALERLALHVGTPISDAGQPSVAVLVGRVDLRTLDEIMSLADDAHESGKLYLVNRFGFFVTEPGAEEGFALQRLARSEGVARGLSGTTGTSWYSDFRGVPVVGAYRWLPDHQMALIAEIDQSEALGPTRQIRLYGVWLMVGAILVFTTLGIVLARTMTHPLRRIAAGAVKIGHGDFSYRIRSRRKDEFGDLSRTFDRMAENLQEITASRDELHREMTARREAEARLRETLAALEESEAHFRDLSESTPIGVYIWGGGVLRYVNSAFEEIFGYARDELVDRFDPINLVCKDDRTRTLKFFDEVSAEAAEPRPLAFRALRKDGTAIACEVVARGHEYDGQPAILGTVTDTTLRDEAERRFRTAAKVASDLIYEWNVETDDLQWFGDIDAALGYESGTIPPTIDGWIGLMHPEDRERLADSVERHRTGMDPIHEEYRVRHCDGSWRYWIDRGAPVRHRGGFPVRWIGVCVDDTERLSAHRALAESEERFRRILENAPDIIYRYRVLPAPGFDYVSPSVEGVNGYTPAEFYADPRLGTKIVHPKDRHHFERLLRGEAEAGVFELRWIHKDGREIWIEDQHVPVFDDEGNLVAIEGVTRDITAWKEALAIRKTADDIVQSIPTGLLILEPDSDGGFVIAQANAAATDLIVEEGESLEGRRFDEVFPPQMIAGATELFRRVLEEGIVLDEEVVVRGEGGIRFATLVRAFPVPEGKVISAFEDITSQKRAEEALRVSEERYRHLFESMMNSFALHEIVLDDEGRPVDYVFLEANAAFERMVGVHREDLVGRRVTEVLPGIEHDPADWIGIYGTVALTGEEIRSERYSEVLGRWYSVLAFSPRSGQFATVFEDITERKLAEAAVIEWKNRYEAAVEASRHLLYDWDSETGDVTYAGALKEMLGYTEAEMAGGLTHWIELIHPEDRPGFETAIDRLLKLRDRAHLRYRVRRKDGEYIHAEDDGSFIVGADGRPSRMLGFVKDVTEARLAAERVEASERRYRAIVELAPIGIVTVGLKGIVESCNDAFLRITGYAREQLVGRHFTKLPPARARDIPRYLKLFAGILRGRPPEAFEATWTTPTGEVRYGEIRVALLGGEDRTWGVQVIVQDITHRKEAEAELRESEAKYRDLVEEIHEILYTVDENGTITYLSPSVEGVIGYTPEEVVGRSYNAFAIEGDARDIETLKDEFTETPDPRPEEARIVAKDGSSRWIRVTRRPILDEGRFAGFRGLIVDVTDEKLAAEARRVSEEKYRSLFENAALGIYQTTPDGRVLAANPALIRMLGYDSFEDLASRNLEEDGYEPETPRERFKEDIERTGRMEGRESVWVRKDGRRLHVRENSVAVRDADGRTLFYEGTVEDITAMHEAEAQRQALEAQLRQTQKLESIGTLASGVAHEINNPLTGMINYAELISRRVEDSRLREFSEAIMTEGGRVAKIVRDLLSFSRREMDPRSPARIADIFTAAMSLVGRLLERDLIRIEADVPESLPRIRCRSQQLQQVFINLLTNARDALNERYPREHPDKILRVTAEEVTRDGSTWIRTVVEDHGTGISPEHLERIFDPFFTTKPRDRGTGLGLSVSFGIVRDHLGRLTVESEEGAFTRFVMELPSDGAGERAEESGSEDADA